VVVPTPTIYHFFRSLKLANIEAFHVTNSYNLPPFKTRLRLGRWPPSIGTNKKNKKPIDLVQFQGCFNTPLQHIPSNLYQHGYNGTPFIVGERGSGWAVL